LNALWPPSFCAKTCYPTEPDGLLALDPQLICYSWITGVSEVAQVVFVRKQLVEIQYLQRFFGEANPSPLFFSENANSSCPKLSGIIPIS
jgi:hypothetical protein